MKVHLVLTVCAVVCNGVLEARHSGHQRDFITRIRKYAPDNDTRPVYVMSIKRPPHDNGAKQSASPISNPLAYNALKIISPPSWYLPNGEQKRPLRRLPSTIFPNVERLIAKRLKVATYRRPDSAGRRKLTKDAGMKPTQETIAAIAEPMIATQKHSQDVAYKSSTNIDNDGMVRSKDTNWPPNPNIYPIKQTSYNSNEEVNASHQLNINSDYLSLFFNQPVESGKKKLHKSTKRRHSEESSYEDQSTHRPLLFSILSHRTEHHSHRYTPDVQDKNRRIHAEPSKGGNLSNPGNDHEHSTVTEDPGLHGDSPEPNLNPDRPDSPDQTENPETSGYGYPNEQEDNDHQSVSSAVEDHPPEYHELGTESPDKLSSDNNNHGDTDSRPPNVANAENESINPSPTDIEVGTDDPQPNGQSTESNNDIIIGDEAVYQEADNGPDNYPNEVNNPQGENIGLYPHSGENYPESESDLNQTNLPDYQENQEALNTPSESEQEQKPDPNPEESTVPTYENGPYYTSNEEENYDIYVHQQPDESETEEPDFEASVPLPEDQYPGDEDEEVGDNYDDYSNIVDNYYEYYPAPSESHQFPYKINTEANVGTEATDDNDQPDDGGDAATTATEDNDQLEAQELDPSTAADGNDQFEAEEPGPTAETDDNYQFEAEESDPGAVADDNDQFEAEESDAGAVTDDNVQREPEEVEPENPQQEEPKPEEPQPEKPQPEEIDPEVAPSSQEVGPVGEEEVQQSIEAQAGAIQTNVQHPQRPVTPAPYRPPYPYYNEDDDDDDDEDDYYEGSAPSYSYYDDDEEEGANFYEAEPAGYYPSFPSSYEDYESGPSNYEGGYDYRSDEERKIEKSKRRLRSMFRKRKWRAAKRLSKKLILSKEAS